MEARNQGLTSDGFGFGFKGLLKFFDLFGFIDDAERKDIGGQGGLKFVAQLRGELTEALDALAEFPFVFQRAGSLCRRGVAGIGINLGRLSSVRS